MFGRRDIFVASFCQRSVRPTVLGFVIALPSSLVLLSVLWGLQDRWGIYPDPYGDLPLLLPLWAWNVLVWGSRAVSVSAAWTILGFAISAAFRLVPFPECFFVGLIAGGLIFVPQGALLTIGQEPLKESLGAILAVSLAFPVVSSLSSMAGGKLRAWLWPQRDLPAVRARRVTE